MNGPTDTTDTTDPTSLEDAENEWRVEAVSSLLVPMPPSRRALAMSLREDVPLPRDSQLLELIQQWVAREANDEVDALVMSLGVALIWYSTVVGDERWRADRNAQALHRAEADIEKLKARLHAVRRATWGR